jgi:alkanesulfonate monooxygenase SsuD/methylene tetrahydromethanopterin reductase-like flavin-dependent oxidoreductase (luciferase family)
LLEHAALHNDHVSQHIDVDDVTAETFALWRQPWQEQAHAGLMPRPSLMRAVHVAETDAIALAEAEQPLLASQRLGVEGIASTGIGAEGTEENPTTRDINRVFQGMRTSDNFWLDNEPALVGSPETVVRQLKEQHQRLGDESFSASHRMGTMPPEQSLTSLRLFGTEVIPAFP